MEPAFGEQASPGFLGHKTFLPDLPWLGDAHNRSHPVGYRAWDSAVTGCQASSDCHPTWESHFLPACPGISLGLGTTNAGRPILHPRHRIIFLPHLVYGKGIRASEQ